MKERNSNIELLRFGAAIGILYGHAANRLIVLGVENDFFTHFMGIFANVGSVILAMISFYFMYNTDFSFQKIFKAWFKTFFYSIAITISLLIMQKVEFDMNILKSMFPVIGTPYWFMTTWIIFSFFRPFVDYIVKKISDFRFICKVCVCLFSIIPFCVSNDILDTRLTYFLLLYLVTIYLKQQGDRILGGLRYIFVIFGLVMLMSVANYIMNFTHFSDRTSPFLLLLGVMVFLFAIKLPAKCNVAINKLGRVSLSIYLLHAHPLIKGKLFWDLWKYENTSGIKFFLAMFIMGVATTGGCFVIDFIENIIYQRLLRKAIIVKFIDNVDKKFIEIFSDV